MVKVPDSVLASVLRDMHERSERISFAMAKLQELQSRSDDLRKELDRLAKGFDSAAQFVRASVLDDALDAFKKGRIHNAEPPWEEAVKAYLQMSKEAQQWLDAGGCSVLSHSNELKG